MKTFIVGFSRAESIFKIGSRFIQLVECRDFSHVYISYKDDNDIKMVAQASHGYVNLVNYDVFLTENTIVKEYEIDCSDIEWLEIEKFSSLNLGKKYSTLQIFWIGLKKLFKLEIKDDINKDTEFICSEWASRICQITGLDIPGDLDYITPSDLHEIIKQVGKKVQ